MVISTRALLHTNQGTSYPIIKAYSEANYDFKVHTLYVNGEINLVLYSQNNNYHLTLKHDINKCTFEFDIIYYTAEDTRKEEHLVVGLKSYDEVHDFIKAFRLYLLSIQYFNYGNEKLYKEKITKLTEKIMPKIMT